MCSYKAWVWLTAIYSIPLILVLLLTDIVTLVGLNAPKLFQYELNDVPIQSLLINDPLSNHHFNDDEPRLGEVAALKRMPYENQFKRNFDQDNSLDGVTNSELLSSKANLVGDLGESRELNDDDFLKDDNLNDDNLKDDNDSEAPNDSSSKATNGYQENTTKPAETPEPKEPEPKEPELKEPEPKEPELKEPEPKQPEPKELEPKESSSSSPKVEEKSTTEKSTTAASKASTADDKPLNEEQKGTTVKDDAKEPKDEEDPEEPPKGPEGSKEFDQNEVLKSSWNEFLYGLYLNDNKLVLNILVFIKLGFRLLSLITLPLLIIGNSRNRSKYIKPFKIILLLQFLYSLGITIYYAIVSTQCNYYRNIADWFPRHFEKPDHETGLNMARLFLMITFFDLFPYFCIISLILINKRDRQITRKKDESQEENWDVQLRPIGLPRINNTANSDHNVSPLAVHFNQSANHNDLPTAGLITNEEISVNNQPFSYTNPNQSANIQTQYKYEYDNQAFNKN